MLVRRHNYPPVINLQWHITEQCNFRCRHCYQKSYNELDPSLNLLLDIEEQFIKLLDFWPVGKNSRPIRGHLTISGGEPFLRPDLLEFLTLLSKKKERYSFAILTNGSCLDWPIARYLKKLGPTFVQVSIDGSKTTHDELRGEGSYEQAVKGLKNLVKAGIRTLISFTAHSWNFRDFQAVANLGSRLKVDRVWADRFIPLNCSNGPKALSPEETYEFIQLMRNVRYHVRRGWFNKTEIAMHRALQFLGGGAPYRCSAGDSLLALQPNGDLYPCRRLPLHVGNVLETPLTELYHRSEILKSLRAPFITGHGCRACLFAYLCRGGLKCMSYAVTGDPFETDPGCWLASYN